MHASASSRPSWGTARDMRARPSADGPHAARGCRAPGPRWGCRAGPRACCSGTAWAACGGVAGTRRAGGARVGTPGGAVGSGGVRHQDTVLVIAVKPANGCDRRSYCLCNFFYCFSLSQHFICYHKSTSVSTSLLAFKFYDKVSVFYSNPSE